MNSGVTTSPSGICVSQAVRNYFEGMAKGPTYLAESEFGLRQIFPFLTDLPEGARVLEVGSGPCILLAEIAERFPHLKVLGIEPMSDGFAFFQDFVGEMRAARPGMNVYMDGYENFSSDETWDLIFLVNVFEHLPDWRHFLGFVDRSLAHGGSCVVLCPNYGFPYESHFKLPVLWNKRITGATFRKRIDRFELENDNAGLYRSLNFVRLSQVRRAARDRGLKLTVETGIISEMIDRLDADPAFRARQKALAMPARFLKGSSLLDWLLRVPLVQDFLPYMKLILSKGT